MSSTTEETLPTLDHDAIRAEVRQIADAEGRTMSAISKEAGIPYGTFSAWMIGKYNGDNDRQAALVQRWLTARGAQARSRAVLPRAPGYVATPSAVMFAGVLEHAQHAPDLVMIAAPAGVGKTTAAQEHARAHPSVWVLTGERCCTTPRMLLESLAELLGVPEQRNAQRTSRAIVQRVRGTSGLLIVDEAQQLNTGVLEQLRTLHDLAEIGVALVGNESVHDRIEGGARSPEFAQLFSRVGMRAPRPTTARRRRDADALLDAWGVGDEGARRLLHAIAREPGALRGMTKALRIGHMQARAAGAEALGADHVRMAWKHLTARTLGEEAAA